MDVFSAAIITTVGYSLGFTELRAFLSVTCVIAYLFAHTKPCDASPGSWPLPETSHTQAPVLFTGHV